MSENLLEFYSPHEPIVGMSLEEISEKALDLISSIPGGVLQSELKRMLQVESSKCSKIVTRLEKSGLIKRQKASLNGARTYLLKPAVAVKPKPEDSGQSTHIKIDRIQQNPARQRDANQPKAQQTSTKRTYAQQSYARQVSTLQTNIPDAHIPQAYTQRASASETGTQKSNVQKDNARQPNAQKASAKHIDTYLTEIYLLYLIRGIEPHTQGTCASDWRIFGDDAARELPYGERRSDDRHAHRRPRP